ncbi:hypothetical protein VTK73DRAFT_5605 [Phialemonium thermophilum]|uniref:feruloyl esterase n=1 Tax=Phialemonium thermophilum TaxID=223376 RepID=A0ABR3WN26_9PEZI
MASLLRVAAFIGSLARASQVVLSEGPPVGNVAYTLPTERTFLLNVPTTYAHGEPYPLVLSFHGAGGFSEKQQRVTELSDPSLTIAGKPFLTVYAQGVNNTDWNMTHIWKGAPYENKTVDDIAYVYDIISTVSSTYTVDKSRIYACGKSNGGGFTALLACRPDTSSVIAAFAPVSPALYQGTYAFYNCSPSRPVPILHSHGFAERNGCRGRYPGEWPQPEVTEVHPGVWEEVWDCPGGAEVRGLTVEGLGHAWPSTLGLDLTGSPNQTANFNFTSQHLVQFFSRHQLE